jgi:hypothetical protein
MLYNLIHLLDDLQHYVVQDTDRLHPNKAMKYFDSNKDFQFVIILEYSLQLTKEQQLER